MLDPAAPFPSAAFTDVLAANRDFAETFQHSELDGQAARGIAVVTCIDSRINPLEVMGMGPGDMKILRNAGARVTDDVLRTLVLAAWLLNVSRVLVMPHTRCRMASGDEASIHAAIHEIAGVDTRSVEIRTVTDQAAALALDLQRIRSYPLLPPDLVVAGGIYDVDTGVLTPLDA